MTFAVFVKIKLIITSYKLYVNQKKMTVCFPLLSKAAATRFLRRVHHFFNRESKARDTNVQPSINRNIIDLRRQISRCNESSAHFTSRTYISLPYEKAEPVHSVTECIMQSFIWYIFYSLKNTLPILYNKKWKIENCDWAKLYVKILFLNYWNSLLTKPL